MRSLVRNPLFLGAGALAVAAGLYLAFGVFGVQTLFYDNTVNEDFEVVAETSPEKESTATSTTSGTEEQKNQNEEPAVEEAKKEEPANPVAVSSGEFHAVDHAGTGTATVYRQPDGSHVLRLEDLNVEDGPDLYVYAIAAPDATDTASAQEAGFVNAGRLKGNVGDQTYELPPDFDPDTHQSVSIWCQSFSSNFATAPLT